MNQRQSSRSMEWMGRDRERLRASLARELFHGLAALIHASFLWPTMADPARGTIRPNGVQVGDSERGACHASWHVDVGRMVRTSAS